MNNANEVVNLIASIIFFIILFRLLRNNKAEIPGIITVAIICVLLGNIFTVVESYVMPTFFNFIEHFIFSLGALLFLIGSIRLYRIHG